MNKDDEIEIDLIDMCKYFWSKCLIILVAILIGIGISAVISKITNKVIYTAETKLYISIPKTSDKVLIRDNANELVLDYLELIESDLVRQKVAKEKKLPLPEIKKSVSVSQIEGKRFIIITTQNYKESRCKVISNNVLKITENTITNVLNKEKPIIIEKTETPIESNTVNFKSNVLIGAALGFIIVIGLLFIQYIIRIRRKSK